MSAHTKPATGLILPLYFHNFITPVLQDVLSSWVWLFEAVTKKWREEKGMGGNLWISQS